MDLSMNHSLSKLTCCSVFFFLNSSMSIILNQSKNSTVSRLKKFGCTKNKPANAFWSLLWFPYSAVYEESVKGWKIKEVFKSVSVTLKKKKKKKRLSGLQWLWLNFRQQQAAHANNSTTIRRHYFKYVSPFSERRGIKTSFYILTAPQCIHSW